jgi:hypothetical protein
MRLGPPELMVVAFIILKGVVSVGLAYVGARLAIRHERRMLE